ncbi:flagellar motor protein PomA [Microvirga tunisiensis]|uniref:Flagellar motor protein PomA n=2 Tax=Pannonibacter tanglangensis TaxID=2750084 RepID=A0A7X5F3Y0_9HYPH|nr:MULTISPECIES: MotA/TolQ/ExbB proton channel family protein [unclassified Pannonibacter]NBN64520.1 flagellar motor protein PomA [Pannonibacter sp. XCT-34]NBN79054.1 flagellar motor protein PomA [Pannonibacter sp. XCT-53]
MDFSTIIGAVVAVVVLVFLVTYEGDPMGFLNMHAGVTIAGGVVAATCIRFPLKEIGTGLKAGLMYSISHRRMHAHEIIAAFDEISSLYKRKGPVALETMSFDDPYLAKAIRMVADGYDKDFIRMSLELDRDLEAHRLETGVKVYKSIGDCAPAFGMVGTLIGMVQMFMNMSDPTKLGPFMAIALLATLYGAVLANFICMPIAEKLEYHLTHDEISESMIIDGTIAVCEAKSPALVREMLQAYMPRKMRSDEAAEAA